MSLWDILIIIGVVVAVVFVALYFLYRWSSKKMGEQQNMIEKNRQETQIFVIDKRRDHLKNVNLPKAVLEAAPRLSRFARMYFVQAKVGPRVVTLTCDKKVFNLLPVKKSVKVDLAGIYISGIKGMKTDYEMKEARKAKALKTKAETRDTKNKRAK